MQTISRLYAAEEHARKAFDDLKRRGYRDIHMFTPPVLAEGEAATAALQKLGDAMKKAFILSDHASVYADRVVKGASLVSVHAPFSGGLAAKTALERYSPIDSGITEPQNPVHLWDDTSPFSSAFRMPLLSKTEHPFETLTGLPSLTKGQFVFGNPSLTDDAAPFSSKLGMPLLCSNPAPLSSMLGMATLMKSGPLFYK
jgi:hypothetical protein